jgi:hypothetical protein
VAHSAVSKSALMHSGLWPVHRGFIAMSGRSLRLAQISDELGAGPRMFFRRPNHYRGCPSSVPSRYRFDRPAPATRFAD